METKFVGSFEWALCQMKQGKEVRRGQWTNTTARVAIGDDHFWWTDCAPGWSLRQDDLLATDWELYAEPQIHVHIGLTDTQRLEVTAMITDALTAAAERLTNAR